MRGRRGKRRGKRKGKRRGKRRGKRSYVSTCLSICLTAPFDTWLLYISRSNKHYEWWRYLKVYIIKSRI